MPGTIDIKELHVSYNGIKVIKGIDLSIPPGKVTALIGPSGCGKTTLLRCLNRLSSLIKGCKTKGKIYLDGEDIQQMDAVLLRRRVGMVFQKPNPFPMSVRENVLYGLKANNNDNHHRRADYGPLVESSLVKAALWEELKDRLEHNAFALSLGQQQRLCFARSLAISPDIILLDEPASSLDPISASQLESSILSIKEECTVVIVTHNLPQALRVSDYVAFIYLGELVEFGETSKVFKSPQSQKTREYIGGKFG
ncbi:MAG: Phosphate import ATP-binding protein PstB 3 [Chloroflexi bacterium]|nr:Phosphate import ATP-binding protein PstB 3 [Chloroflexota bacterium]